jgi:beta-mannosidase
MPSNASSHRTQSASSATYVYQYLLRSFDLTLPLLQVEKNRPDDRPRQFYEFGNFRATSATLSIWGTNSTLKPRSATLQLTFVDLLDSGWTEKTEKTTHVLAPNSSTELGSVPVKAPRGTTGSDAAGATVVVGAVVADQDTGEVLARMVDWPQPLALADFPSEPGLDLRVDLQEGGTAEVRIEARRPVKGLVLGIENPEQGEEVHWDDNVLDIMPGEVYAMKAEGVGKRKVTAAYMGSERARVVG